MTDCKHHWEFGGLRYKHADYPLPGSGAYGRVYTDWFYCRHCLANEYRNERVIGNSYEKPLEGSAPR